MSFFSVLEKVTLENLAADPASVSGRMYLNTSTGPKWYDGAAWRVAATLDSTQTFTNKTFDAAKVSTYLDYTEVAAPSNPSAGFQRMYAKSDGKFYKRDSAGTEVEVGSGATGSGEINIVANPSAASATTGWTAGASHTNTRDSSNSPLASVTSTCFAMSSSAAVALGSQTSTTGIYYPITMPTGLRSKKLKFEFYMTTPAAADGTWAIAVYEGTTRLALSTDSSGDTILPSGVTGKFTTTFDTSSASAYTVLFIQRTRTIANTLYVTSIISGPGIQPQGAVVGPVIQYTPTVGPISGYSEAPLANYYRDGEELVARGHFRKNGSAGIGAGRLSCSLPSGLTIRGSAVAINGARIGGLTVAGTSGFIGGLEFNSGDLSNVYFIKSNGAPLVGTDVLASNEFYFDFRVPISEWAGSGTVNLAQNDVEYVSNSGTTWTADDTTSFAYGQGGSAVPPSALAAQRTRRVSFQTPIKASDSLVIEASTDQVQWFELPTGGIEAYSAAGGTNTYGISINSQGSPTTANVQFGKYRRAAGSWDGAGVDWSGGLYWRIRKVSGGQAVGFGLATATQSGLVTLSQQTVVSFDLFNPSDLVGTVTNATARTIDRQGTGPISVSTISAGVITFTFNESRDYEVAIGVKHSHSNAYTNANIFIDYAGTATRYTTSDTFTTSADDNNDGTISNSDKILVSATAGQTLTVKMSGRVSGSGTTTNHNFVGKVYIKAV